MTYFQKIESDSPHTADHGRTADESVIRSSGTPGPIVHSFQDVVGRVRARSSILKRLQVVPQVHAMAFLC